MSQYALYARKSQEDEGRQQQSIDDQVRIMTEVAERTGLCLVRTLHEERSAKEPYERPIFDELIRMVKDGEVDSILCYHANRLARNMVEGGLLQHLLTKGKLREIRTHSEVFRTGDNILPFVLQTAMSTQYSLDLSTHVRRGISSKVEKGGYPQRAPEGYVNNLFEHTIEQDSERFPLVRKAWELMLTGSYSIDRLVDIMESWGYRTRKSRKLGGNPIAKSSLHHLFHNLFYTGYFIHKGEMVRGSHTPMITFEEYHRVQKILGRNGTTRPKSREFPYTGLILCARCGRQVTAEHKRGRLQKGDYTYYHCSNYQACGSKAVRQEVIEEQIERYLKSVAISPTFRDLAVGVIERAYAEESEKDHAQIEQQHRSLEDSERRMSKLIKMSIKEMISDEEFEKEKLELQGEINELRKATVQAEHYLETARRDALDVVNFVTTAPYEFAGGTIQKKREIARKLGITYRLQDGVLETQLSPLLEPFYQRPVEPLETGSENRKDGSSEPPVSSGWAEWTKIESSMKQLWRIVLLGRSAHCESAIFRPFTVLSE